MVNKKKWTIQEQAHLLVIFEKNKDSSAAKRVAARQFARSESSVYQKYTRVKGSKAVNLYKDKYFDKNNIADKLIEVKKNLDKVEIKKQNPEVNLPNQQKVMTLELRKIGFIDNREYFLDKSQNVIIVNIVD